MPHVTVAQALAISWVATLAWSLAYGIAAVEAGFEWKRNRDSWLAVRNDPNASQGKKLVSRGRNRKSRNFFCGFLLGLMVGLTSIVYLVEGVAPPPPTAVGDVINTALIVSMGVFFWRAKHADWRTRREAQHYARKEEEEGQVD